MSRRALGWLWVAGQVVLLGALVLLPGRSDWSTPTWVVVLGTALLVGGLALVAAASLRLGRALTPTPVPVDGGELTTSGLYRFVRHPIYTGVLAVVAGIVVRSGSWIQLALGVATFVFFDRKAAWEEQQLAEQYPDYRAYAGATPKFFPRP